VALRLTRMDTRSLSWFPAPILALESSCDETSAAITLGSHVVSNVVSSQAALHEQWGGVVPEAAARAHVESIIPTIHRALEQGQMKLGDVGAIAVTNRPGLVGALSVAVTAAKALAMALQKPLIGIHHLEGHLLSVLQDGADVPFPHMALVASGGHTELVLVRMESGVPSYRIVGHTIDDAAGEAFDKSARVFGLGYPGGKAIQDSAAAASSSRYSLPQGLAGDTLNFSFSGLKTAAMRLAQAEGTSLRLSEAAYAVQEAITRVLEMRTLRAAEEFRCTAITLVGGVAANTRLRIRLAASCERAGISFHTPPLDLCTDNAAMIGLAASLRLARNERDGYDLDTLPNADLP
jgi:N6-L-threonylcarbamoyladenine synthase